MVKPICAYSHFVDAEFGNFYPRMRSSRFWFLYCVFVIIIVIISSGNCAGNDFYELLGVSKDADNLEIRRSFKKLALSLHPDKHPNDPGAHERFIQITRAYEVLKDEQLRKKYDLHGEDGLKNDFKGGQKYQSWQYYHENFGIYDNDPEIITLSSSDFAQSVAGTSDKWFINFYSPWCSHCHDLAPTWRALARDLEGVVRFGAVNCEEDWILCRQQDINSYPSLLFYPGREKYYGDRSFDDMISFLLGKLTSVVIHLTKENIAGYANDENYKKKPWLLFACEDGSECPSKETEMKLAAILEGMVSVATINCDLLRSFGENSTPCGVIFKPIDLMASNVAHVVESLDGKEIVKEVLDYLPNEEVISWDTLKSIRENITAGKESPWLLHFVKSSDKENLEFRKLPSLLPEMHVGKLNCDQQVDACTEFYIHKYPSFVVLKKEGGHEIYHGRMMAHDVATFARESVVTNVETLGPQDFPERVVNSGEPWFIDFFAPWCPPCMQLLPEWRKASKAFGSSSLRFGTVDCTIHHALCNNYNIRSYPTTVLYNRSIPHAYQGDRSAAALVDFVQDILSPVTVALSETTFQELVGKKSHSELWLVDFYAPWCGPCQQLAPEWRKMAKTFTADERIHVGQVDCTAHPNLCNLQGVHSYPTIKLYPLGYTGAARVVLYGDWHRDAQSLRAWVFHHLPSSTIEMDNNDFYNDIIYSSDPWIVDFYSPRCGHCHLFAPDFEIVAEKLKGRVKAAKVNCQVLYFICQQAEVRMYPTVRFYPGSSNIPSGQNIVGEEIRSRGINDILNTVESFLTRKRELRDEL